MNKTPFRGVKYAPLASSISDLANAASGRVSRWRRQLPLLMAVVFGCFLLVAVMMPFFIHRTINTTNDDGPQLAIRLHPEVHAIRKPRTLTFDWNITIGKASPDGVEKEIYLINNKFPGPTIEARSGDRIIVNTHNSLPNEGLSLHWHGLRLKGYNAMDGTVGFTQCAISSGQNFTYDFEIGAEEHGTFWWHSHSQVQRGDGLFGGLVVHKPTSPESEFQPEYLLLAGDWFHRRQKDVLDWFSASSSLGNEPVPDSIIINGRGRYNCSMAVPARPIICRDLPANSSLPIFSNRYETSRLRIVNVGTIAGLSVSVPGAVLRPLEVEGGWPVQAENANTNAEAIGVLYPGERIDAILEWKRDLKNPWMNIYLDDENFGHANPALKPEHAFAALPESLRSNIAPIPPPLDDIKPLNLSTLSSSQMSVIAVPEESDITILFYLKTQILSHLGNKPTGFFNHTTWKPQTPPLLSLNRSSWDENQLLPFIPSESDKPTQVTLVFNNLDDGSHPIHLHGNSFYVLSSFRAERGGGWGSYNPYDPNDKPGNPLNLQNPIRKDTAVVPRHGHLIIRVVADNPGLWMLHCHMLVHLGTGMGAGLHIGAIGDEAHFAGIDDRAAKLCAIT